MINATIVDVVRQQLAAGVCPTAAQTEALLRTIDTFHQELGQQKQIEAALHESEARYRAIADLTSDYAYVLRIEPDGRLVSEWTTDAFTSITGYTLADIDARGGWLSLIYPDDLSIATYRQQALLTGQNAAAEFRIVTKTGQVRWLHDCWRPEWDAAHERIVRIFGAASDITERKQAEEELRASKEQLARIVETNANGIIIADRTTRITFANAAAKRILNVHPDSTDELMLEAPNYSFPQAAALLQKIYRTGENVCDVEYALIDPDGRQIILSINAAPLRDANGRINGLVASLTDITNRKRSEESVHFLADASKLLASSLDYETTLEQVARLAVPFLADACFVDLIEEDHTVRRLVVAHAEQDREQLFQELHQRYQLDQQMSHPIARVLQTGQPELIASLSHSLLERVVSDDEQRDLLRQFSFSSAMIVPLLVRDRVLGTMMFVTEYASRHYDHNDLALAQELGSRAGLAVDNARLFCEAQSAVAARDEFLSIASHELKTPTAALLTATHLVHRWITQQQDSSDQVQRELEVMTLATRRLNKLIDSLTEFAHIQTGRFHLELRPVELCALVKQLVDELQTTPRHYVSLICPDESFTVQGDAARLERALHNLMRNAVKYSPRGGPIIVQLQREDEFALIRVTDSGIGIPQDALPHLFERFYRAENVLQQNIGGMGIGLYLVKEIVTRHGGEVEVSSEEGQGSTFTIRLPLHQ